MLAYVIQVVLYAHLIWLSFYFYSRASGRKPVRSIAGGLGLLAVAVALGPYVWNSSEPGSAGVPVMLYLLFSIGSMLPGVVSVFGLYATVDRDTARWFEGLGWLLLSVPAALLLLVFADWEFVVPWGATTALACIYLLVGIFAAKRISADSGEALLPDLVRSYDYSFLIAAVFGGQVALAMWAGPGATKAMTVLLLGTITASIGIQVFLERVQGLLDHVAFANVPWLRQERASLRKIENVLPRVNMTDPLTIPADEFSKLTRRALSNYSDLTKLATSPLTNLPEVHRRLLARNVEPSTLERARELKVLLAEAIERLRPMNGEELGTTDEWRFYNALYYPYIVGMRPYSNTAAHSFETPGHYDVLAWFRTYVPERTLYNWQNSAAALIAGHLREQEESAFHSVTAPSAELTAAS